MQGRTVYLCGGLRTPIGRYAGALSKVRADELAAYPLRALMAAYPKHDWARVDEVIYGQVVPSPLLPNVGCEVSLLPQLPRTVPAYTCESRWRSSAARRPRRSPSSS